MWSQSCDNWKGVHRSIYTLLLVAGGLSAQPFGPDAVFRPGPDFVSAAMEKCGAFQPPRMGECFIAQMQGAGASSQALAFARLLHERMGQVGYMREFRDTGRVDIAYVQYAFRANELNGVSLIDGSPPLVDVDRQDLLDQAALERHPVYAALRKQYPEVVIFPADRFYTGSPAVAALPGGGQRFTVAYRLNNVCRACAQVGTARFGFDFDPAGKFLGTRLLSVQAAERARSRSSARRSQPARFAPAS